MMKDNLYHQGAARRQALLDLLNQYPDSYTIGQLAAALECGYSNIASMLQNLVTNNEACKSPGTRGKYIALATITRSGDEVRASRNSKMLETKTAKRIAAPICQAIGNRLVHKIADQPARPSLDKCHRNPPAKSCSPICNIF